MATVVKNFTELKKDLIEIRKDINEVWVGISKTHDERIMDLLEALLNTLIEKEIAQEE